MKKSLIFIFSCLIMIIAACSKDTDGDAKNVDEEALDNLTEKGFPIVEDPISVEMFTASDPSNDWNDHFIWNEYADMTNIDVEWEQIPNATLEEKRNLRLAGTDLPDAFYGANFGNLDIFKYGKQGTFIPLNDLIEEHAPNLVKMLDEYPEVRKALTFPDGNIYSLPTIQDPEFLSLLVGARPWFNMDFLDELDMDIPETTEEFHDYLTAVKEENPGDADAVPYGGRYISELVRWLRGSFGLNAQGNPNIDLDPET